MANPIVTVNVAITSAPAPSTLQRTGAFVTQGGTTNAAGTLTLLTQQSDLTAILANPVAVTTMTWSGGTVSVTTSTPHGWGIGDVVAGAVLNVAPVGYNGAFTFTITGASTLTYPVAVNPGAVITQGVVELLAQNELKSMGKTFFAQPAAASVYVLELGEGTPTAGVTALTSFINQHPDTIYSYLIPREWDNLTAFMGFIPNYDAPNKKTYFFVTTTTGNQTVYTTHKCVFAMVEAPNLPINAAGFAPSEFSCAAPFAVTLGYNPTSTNKTPPLSYAFLYGVTPWSPSGNQTNFANFATNNINYILVAAEGGLPNTMLVSGHMQDGNPFNFWYSADWAQINIHLALANEVINGSNDNISPLYYDQDGINRLQNRAIQTMATAITNGLALGIIKGTQLPAAQFEANYTSGQYAGFLVINAEPFLVYTNENPNDYASGNYGGLACVYTPLRGFESVVFNLNVTNLIF